MNNKSWLMVVGVAFLGVGCATPQAPETKVPPVAGTPSMGRPRVTASPDAFDPLQFTAPDRTLIFVWIDNDKIIYVDQEPVRRPKGNGTETFIWKLQQGYYFPDDAAPNRAIELTQTSGTPGTPTCGRINAAKYSCTFTGTQPGTWKYWIRVKRHSDDTELQKLDPSIVQY